MDSLELHYPMREKPLPEVLSKQEVVRILKTITNLKHKAMISTIYACGLRRGELLNLKVKDLDGQRNLIRIEQGKGTDIRYIQELLGHSSPKTTMIYTHVSNFKLAEISSPFDDLHI